MLDPKLVREDAAALRDAMRRREKLDLYGPLLDELEALDRTRRTSIARVEERKAERNRVTQDVGKRKKAGEDASELQASARVIGEEIAALEAQLEVTQARFDDLLLGLPNLTLPEVPAGDESQNVIVRSWGEPRAAESVKPHWEVGEAHGLFDLPRGAKVSGSGFIVYRGAGARLVRSMMNLMLDLHTTEFGYEETWVPVVVNRATMTGTGQLPKFEDDMYALKDEDLFLIPTAEVPVTNLYRDEILAADELPKAL
ncbi:MAG TPA: serine--tRNA ligase, partial [Gemmatimonadaceae bacterium]|nr:serine--tRNA ligase [Gemmatimonadaceae bacterium]